MSRYEGQRPVFPTTFWEAYQKYNCVMILPDAAPGFVSGISPSNNIATTGCNRQALQFDHPDLFQALNSSGVYFRVGRFEPEDQGLDFKGGMPKPK